MSPTDDGLKAGPAQTDPSRVRSLALFARLCGDALRFPGRLTIAIVSVVVLSVSQLYFTWLLKLWVEGPLASGRAAEFHPLMVQAVVTTFAAIAALFGTRWVLVDMNQRFIESLRLRAFESLLALRLDAVQERATGDLVSRLLGDAGALANFLPTVLKRLIGEALLIVGAASLMFVIDWKIAAFVFVLIPICGAFIMFAGQSIRRRSAEARARTGELSALLTEQIRGITTVKIFQAEAHEAERFARRNAEVRGQIVRAEFVTTAMISGVFIITGIGLLAIIWFGTNHFAAAAVSQAGLLAFTIYGAQIVEPVRRLAEIHAILQQSLASAARVYEIIDDGRGERRPSGGPSLPSTIGMTAANVSLDYGDGALALDDVSIRIAPNEQVAIAGASGSGKTSLTRLLVGFNEPTDGVVEIGDIPIPFVSLAELRRHVCVVEQDPFIFSGTLHENIRYGNPDASAELVRHARELTGLTAANGFGPLDSDLELSEAGRDLSGGERQRVALARAVLRDPSILVLDEATSAMDSEAETAIMGRMASWLEGRTVICISHRFSTVARFPRLIVIERGRLIADGPVDQVLGTSAAFRALFREQIAAREPTDIALPPADTPLRVPSAEGPEPRL